VVELLAFSWPWGYQRQVWLGGSLQLLPRLMLPMALIPSIQPKPLTDLRPVVLIVGLSGLRNSNLPMPSRAPAPLVALAALVALAGLGGPVVAVLPLAASVGLAAAAAVVLPCSSERLQSTSGWADGDSKSARFFCRHRALSTTLHW
jgi:hypothetical protein